MAFAANLQKFNQICAVGGKEKAVMANLSSLKNKVGFVLVNFSKKGEFLTIHNESLAFSILFHTVFIKKQR